MTFALMAVLCVFWGITPVAVLAGFIILMNVAQAADDLNASNEQ